MSSTHPALTSGPEVITTTRHGPRLRPVGHRSIPWTLERRTKRRLRQRWRLHQSGLIVTIVCGGFRSHGGTSIAGCFISWKMSLKWMIVMYINGILIGYYSGKSSINGIRMGYWWDINEMSMGKVHYNGWCWNFIVIYLKNNEYIVVNYSMITLSDYWQPYGSFH